MSTARLETSAPLPGQNGAARRTRFACRRSTGAGGKLSGQQARFLGALIFLVLFVLSLFAEFLANENTDPGVVQGDALPCPRRLPGGEIRRLSRCHRLPLAFRGRRDQRQWLDDLAADPLFVPDDQPRNPGPRPSPASWRLDKETRCSRYPLGVDDPNCTIGNWNWLGTDDQARDVLARLIYGFRFPCCSASR
jgi:microcin C transport system permease protein